MGFGGGSTAPVQESPAKAVERNAPVDPANVLLGEDTPEEDMAQVTGRKALRRPVVAPSSLSID